MNRNVDRKLDPRIGTGDWAGFAASSQSLESVFDVATTVWKPRVADIEKPWLCWNVSPRWSVLQQRLVKRFGWTPVVGFDPRCGPPPLEPGAVLIDFNESFGFPVLWPHFPLEFAFLWTKRLAFWHADLLCRFSVMEELVRTFDALADGEMAAVLDKGGRRNYLNFKSHRYWELAGCTTQAASENQFHCGTGWWRNFHLHAKCTVPAERANRQRYSYDSGVGILYWKNHYRGALKTIDLKLVLEGHCSEIRNKQYVELPGHTTPMRDLTKEIDMNYDLTEVASRLALAELVP
jgi:hypothetical protein